MKPVDPTQLLDSISEDKFEKDRFLPYWAELWPAAEVLFSYPPLRTLPRLARICDLGCGLGVVSARLAERGHNVVSADISPEACVYARANIASVGRHASVACTDWRRPPFSRRFDIVVAADVLYEEQCLEPVVVFLKDVVARNGRVIIADPCRKHWESFKTRVAEEGFEIQRLERRVVNDGKTVVEILDLRKSDE